MRNHIATLLSAVLGFGFANVAAAADLPVKAAKAPVAVVADSWTGFYVGANVGAAWLKKSVTELGPGILANPPAPGYTRSLSDSAVTAGVQAGYNWQVNQWLLGIEGDINWTDIDKTIDASGEPNEIDDILRGKVRWFGTIRGRLGFAPANWLFYVTGGGAVARLTNAYGDTDAGLLNPDDATEVIETRWGWTAGGGIEHSFAPGWSVKLEYLYMDFGTFTATTLTPGEPGVVEFDDRMHVARVGVNYNFHAGRAPVMAGY